MSKRASFRFIVDAGDRRSTVWNISVNKNDVYVTGSVSSQTKVSIHESGAINWSIRSESVENAPYVPERGRHLAQWREPQVSAGSGFRHVFFILIPESELSAAHPMPTTTKEVVRLPVPPKGRGSIIGFYFFDKLGDSSVNRIEPESLFWHAMRNGRVLILVDQTIDIDPETSLKIKSCHLANWEKAKSQGVEKFGGATARITNYRGVSGLMDLTPDRPFVGFSGNSTINMQPRWEANRVEVADQKA
ncbi:hypothetical protein [Burkholderia ubonensis]|uniref:hypothetical protein n=1 Tax=Burkholderia ubonensis TaxID=101571 RepID=UPI0015827772|nr:hypothetical protein [Burkholderia ubonensis]